jgi:hypothetical protein
VLFRSAVVTPDELARVTGWRLEPEGLCREDRCVPFVVRGAHGVTLEAVATALGSPLVHDARHGLWALGAQSGGHALATATAPDLELPDADGRPFHLASLRGLKVVLIAWASW